MEKLIKFTSDYSCFETNDNFIKLICSNEYDNALGERNYSNIIEYDNGIYKVTDFIDFFKQWKEYLDMTPTITRSLKIQDLACPLNVESYIEEWSTTDYNKVEQFLIKLSDSINNIKIAHMNAETNFKLDHMNDMEVF